MWEATKPDEAEPKVKPQNINVDSSARLPRGAYSLIKVTVFGIAAPSPRPVKKRKPVSDHSDQQAALERLANPKISADATITFLRPETAGHQLFAGS
jgi:hypothetical protein